jgi:hypothetical protein
MRNRFRLAPVIALAIMATVQVNAAPETTVSTKAEAPQSNRQLKKIGAYLGIGGDPAPTVVGLNAAYNITDYLRLHAGYGEVEVTSKISFTNTGITASTKKMTTLGAGALATVPGWSISPVAGLAYSHVFTSGDGEFDVANNNVYGTVGVDYTNDAGMNIGVGYNLFLTEKAQSGAYVNLGYFFM